MLRIIRLFILFTVFLTPLIQARYPLGYEQIKVLFFVGSVVVSSFLLFLYFSKRKTNISLELNKVDTIAIFFIFWLFITSAIGINPTSSIFGMPSYYQGAIIYLILLIFYFFFRFTKISRKDFSRALIISSFFVALDALFEWVQLNILGSIIPTYNGRVVSTFGQPNLYSGFLLMVTPLLINLLTSEKKKFFKIFLSSALVFNILAIIASGSRASIILMLIIVIFYLLGLRNRLKIFYNPVIIILVILSVFTVFNFLPRTISKEIIDPLDKSWVSQNAPEKRILIWQVGLTQIINRPITGYGLESFRDVYKDYFSKISVADDKAIINRKNIVVDRTHNYILDLLVFSGVVGALLWIMLVLSLLKRARGVVIISLLIYIIWVQIQIQSIAHLIYFWSLAAVISSQSRKISSRVLMI